MDLERPASRDGRPTEGWFLPPRVAVVAMKPHLRGRIRRNVVTLLELGADVTVVTVPGRGDVLVGLRHPRLRAELIGAQSAYTSLAMVVSRGVTAAAQRRARLVAAKRRALESLETRRSARTARARTAGALTTGARTGSTAVGPARPSPFLQVVHAGDRGFTAVARGVDRAGLLVTRTALRAMRDVLLPAHRVTRFLSFWRRSAAFVEQLRPELVVSSDLPGIVGAGIAARRLGVPHLHDCHELYLESTSFGPLERALLAPVERRYMRRANSIVAVNTTIAQEYGRRYGVRPVVLRNCAERPVDLVERDLRALAALPSTAQVLLYQGGFAPGRGLDVCVAALSRLPPDVHLVLLGYGPLQSSVAGWAQAAGVSQRVHVLPAVPPEELAGYTVSASLGLIPYQPVSRNNLYSLPNKVFEYTAVGVPLVASDLPELRRVVQGEGCGEVYEPYDPGSLAQAVAKVLDPQAHPRYREAAQRFGTFNDWTSERRILVRELTRLHPGLGTADTRRQPPPQQ